MIFFTSPVFHTGSHGFSCGSTREIGTNIHITGMLTHRTELITSDQPGSNIDTQVSPSASVCYKTN